MRNLIATTIFTLIATIVSAGTSIDARIYTDGSGTANTHIFMVSKSLTEKMGATVGIIGHGSHDNSGEVMVGFDRLMFAGEKSSLVLGAYLDRGFGSDAENSFHVLTLIAGDYNLSEQVALEGTGFVLLPMNTDSKMLYIIEQARISYSLTDTVSVGGGYASCHTGGESWDHQPFVFGGKNTSVGNWELWLQHNSGDAQVKLQYGISF